MHVYSIIAFVTSLVAAAVLMRWLLALCHKRGIYGVSGSQDATSDKIPRIGGAVFFPSLLLGVLASLFLRVYEKDIADTIHLSTFFIGCGTMTIYIFGILDDFLRLSRTLKWCIKLAACAVFPLCSLIINDLYGFLGIHELGLASSFFITLVASFLVVESINAADDTDGLAGTLSLIFVSIIGTQFYLLGYYTYANLGFALAGALVVYLYYNVWGDVRIGTKVHMGNCGSLTLGFTLAYLAVKYAMDNKHVMASRPDALLTAYSLLIVPVYDYILVSVKGLWLGAGAEAKRKLRFQHLLRRCGLSSRTTIVAMAIWALWFYILNKGMNYCGVGLTWIVVCDVIVYAIVRVIIAECSQHGSKTVDDCETAYCDLADDYHGEEGLVSVIMPTWNSSRFVAESIESVLAQSYSNLELIITDDASSDTTPDILNQYAAKDPRVRIILNKSNGGAGRSRNCSIREARGQYIAFCDSDDRWMPTKLERQVAFMREKDVDLCFCPYYTCGETNEYLGYVSAPQRVSLFQMMCDNKIGFLTAIYDTRRLGKHLMPAQRKRQDHALLLTLLKQCRHAYSVSEPLAHYRLHSGNMSANKMGLLRYNAMTYNYVFGWPAPLCWMFLFTCFIPAYFWKRIRNLLINISRTQLG